MSSNDRRVRRLLRWYPRSWRATHEKEFSALVEDSLAERPFWTRRGFNVALEGTRLRMATAASWIETGRPVIMGAVFVAFASLFAAIGIQQLFINVGTAQEVIGTIFSTALVTAGVLAIRRGIGMLRHRAHWRTAATTIGLGASLFGLIVVAWWKSTGYFNA